jgi:hypothetical protein
LPPASVRVLANPTLVVVAVSYALLLTVAFRLGRFITLLTGAARVGGIIAALVSFVLLLSLWRYAYSVLRRAAQGHTEVFAPALEEVGPFNEWRLTAHFIVFPALIVWLGTGGPAGGVDLAAPIRAAAALALVAAFPASAALMGLTGSLPHALNPASIAGVARSMGHRYVALLLACGGVFAAGMLLRFGRGRIGGLGPWLGSVAALWSILAVFALIGATLRDMRERFAIPGDVEPEHERRARDRRREWQAVLDRVYASLRSGLNSRGDAELGRLIDSEDHSVEIYQWIFDAMWTWEDRSHALQLAPRYIARLIEAGDMYPALKRFMQCRHSAERFSIAPSDARALADFARSIGYAAAAEALETTRAPRVS